MKFFIVLISLLMITFGGIFTTFTHEDVLSKIKNKIEYKSKTLEQQAIVDKYIRKYSTRGFFVFIVGICLFIASFFL